MGVCEGELAPGLLRFSMLNVCGTSPSETVNVWCVGGVHLVAGDVGAVAGGCDKEMPLLPTLADLTIEAVVGASTTVSVLLGGALAARGGAVRNARRASCVKYRLCT